MSPCSFPWCPCTCTWAHHEHPGFRPGFSSRLRIMLAQSRTNKSDVRRLSGVLQGFSQAKDPTVPTLAERGDIFRKPYLELRYSKSTNSGVVQSFPQTSFFEQQPFSTYPKNMWAAGVVGCVLGTFLAIYQVITLGIYFFEFLTLPQISI